MSSQGKESAMATEPLFPSFVVIYDIRYTGDDDDTEEYYGYFSTAEQAATVFNSLASDNTCYKNVKVCRVVKTLAKQEDGKWA